jgi:DNA-binding transcriptional MerR regulator
MVENRRRTIASLRLRGLTIREIETALLAAGKLNPNTGKPWTIYTISSDLKVIESQWREDAARDISELKAKQLAEIGEVKLEAWKKGAIKNVLAALDREMKLTGTAASEKLELTVTAEMERIITALIESLEGEALEKALAAIEGINKGA